MKLKQQIKSSHFKDRKPKAKGKKFSQPMCVKAVASLEEGADKQGLINSVPGFSMERVSA